MVADERLINPNDGPASSDDPRPGDTDLAEAVDETEGIGGVAGMDPEEGASMTDLDGANEENERPIPPGD